MKKIFLFMLAVLFVTTACNGQAGKKKGGKESKVTYTIHLTKADFKKKVFDFESATDATKYLGDKPALVDFYTDWCPPCKQIAPILEELAAEYKDRIYIYKVNVDDEAEISTAYNVQSIPTLLFVPMNGKPQTAVGAMSKAEFKEIIDRVLLGGKK